MKKTFGLYLFFAAFVSSISSIPSVCLANEAARPFAGVWRGTLGNQAITACFNARERNLGTGAYYHQRRLLPIRLALQGDPAKGSGAVWREEKKGTWRISEVTPSSIRGVWKGAGESKNLPIRLKKVAQPSPLPDPDYDECGSDAYNLALEASPKILSSAVSSAGNIQYRKLSLNLGEPDEIKRPDKGLHFTTIQLLGHSPVIASINRDLFFSPEELFRHRRAQCSRTQGLAGVSVIAHWLTVNTVNQVHCPARSEMWVASRMWNLTTGEPDNLLTWFAGGESERGEASYGSLPAGLAEWVFDRFGEEEDGHIHLSREEMTQCYGNQAPRWYWYRLRLAGQGITFELPITRSGSCGDSYTFTFDRLSPFLNEKGEKAVATIQKAQKPASTRKAR